MNFSLIFGKDTSYVPSLFFAKLMFLNTLINNHFKPRIIFLLTHVVQKVNLRLRDVHFCCRFFDFVFVRYIDFDFVRYFDFDCARCFDLSSLSFTEQQERSNLWGQNAHVKIICPLRHSVKYVHCR